MCGIYGISRAINDELATQKLEVMNFRGPDYSNHVHVGNCTLGHNRLSILDIDARSNQPFQYGSLVIVFNGEIYNFRELRNDLIKDGMNFRTSCDTEVLCAAYQAYGEKCVERLEGMFAFVIYDLKKDTLFGARDRFGQKPLYYSLADGFFEFSSELKSITYEKKYQPNAEAVSQFLKWKYIPEPLTIYQEVKKIPAAHAFTYNLSNCTFRIWPFYEIPKNMEYADLTFNEAMESLDVLLGKAVKKRMVSDVPLGVFLSGGIDSSLIAAYAAESTSGQLDTFSIKFHEEGFDESPYAEEVAKSLGTNHHTIPCEPEEGIDLIENFHLYFTEPFADSSAIPTMLLSKHTRKHVTVALSGDAGDEAFLGYDRYRWMQMVHSVYNIPRPIRKIGSHILAFSPNHKHKAISRGIKQLDLGELYIDMMSSLESELLIDPKLGRTEEYSEWLYTDKPWIERYSDYDLKTYLNGDINTKVDRASMAFSLEVRSPFLDHSLVDFAKTLPIDYRFLKGKQKHILRELLSKKVPRELIDRPKRGFTMPFAVWFRTNLKPMVLDTLTSENLSRIPNLNVDFALKSINDHMNGQANGYSLIWSLMVLLNWMDHN